MDPDTDKLNKPSGGGTVAGETFAGETYDGTASVSAASMEYLRRYRDDDEDEASKSVHNLGTIQEANNSQSDIEADDEEANVALAGQQASQAFGSGDHAASFEDVALQSMQGSLSSANDELSQGFEPSLSTSNRMGFNSTPSYDSTDNNSQSAADALSLRENSARRPRTVSEIEALLSADLGPSDDGSIASDASGDDDVYHRKPRTVEEIESRFNVGTAVL
ncbi:MAG: hypothetical protein SGARI_003653 [Bacillariaceae sp.]